MNGEYNILERYVFYNYGYSLAFDDAFDDDDLDLLEDESLKDFEDELMDEGIEDIEDLDDLEDIDVDELDDLD
jgi:hypothetical protein